MLKLATVYDTYVIYSFNAETVIVRHILRAAIIHNTYQKNVRNVDHFFFFYFVVNQSYIYFITHPFNWT